MAGLRSIPWLICAFLLSGCADYMNNRDTITLGAGDASEANMAIQTIDPFPPDAKNTDIRIDPNKVHQAYQRYLAGPQQPQAQSLIQIKNNNPCDYADQTARDGSRCGGRAANERPGGENPPG